MVLMFAAMKRDAPQGVRHSRLCARSSAQQRYPSPCMLLLQVHTLMQQSQAMTAQQLQAFAAQTQAVQIQGQLPGAAALQQAAAGGVQQPGAAPMPQLPQMSGVVANPRRPMSGQLPGAAALQQAAAGGAQQPGAALMPQPPQMSGVTANPHSPSPAQLPAAQPAAVLPAFQGMLRGPGDQLAAPAVQVGKASQCVGVCAGGRLTAPHTGPIGAVRSWQPVSRGRAMYSWYGAVLLTALQLTGLPHLLHLPASPSMRSVALHTQWTSVIGISHLQDYIPLSYTTGFTTLLTAAVSTCTAAAGGTASRCAHLRTAGMPDCLAAMTPLPCYELLSSTTRLPSLFSLPHSSCPERRKLTVAGHNGLPVWPCHTIWT